ncbi:MAG: GDP-mannose 4,6-dehydratase [Myxococcales bacterium]|nr:GDP-mannose 4,6-dehydratase [Myxococcales bacterium]
MNARPKRALITGITGQDGSYLAELLLQKGYEVHGVLRRSSSFNTGRIEHLYRDPHDPAARLHLHHGDVLDSSSLLRILAAVQPDEVYNLAAQSHVRVSFDMPVHSGDVIALGTARLLEAIRDLRQRPRFYQASSSEMFGASPPPQHEATPFAPRSPYAAAKLYAHFLTVNYREAHGLFACSGILFNHESPRRGETFVTRKVTRAAARIKCGQQDTLYMGNLDARRDWGFAGDYVDAMWRMLQAAEPRDYVIATGESHSVRELLDEAFGYLGLDWRQHVEIDPRYFRPTEVDELRGDARLAQAELGWTPTVRFRELVRRMIDADLAKCDARQP